MGVGVKAADLQLSVEGKSFRLDLQVEGWYVSLFPTTHHF